MLQEKQVPRSVFFMYFFKLINSVKFVALFLSKIIIVIIISPVPFRASSILHWGFVVGVPSQPGECWGIKADREPVGRYLESPRMPRKREKRHLFLGLLKEEKSLTYFYQLTLKPEAVQE